MNRTIHTILALALLPPLSALAFPPAPHHEIHGLVRDSWGNPIMIEHARIVLRTDAGTEVRGILTPGMEPGLNYRLLVPMDAAITPDPYRRNALRELVPFRIRVQVGNTTYLPIQMQGDYALLGEPAGLTRIDLTLGVDSDGDGLPDAWKDMVIAMMGGGLTRADVRPHNDLDGDGMTNLEEYIAGTYAWDPNDKLWLEIIEVRDGDVLLEFSTINGRSYRIWGSNDLRDWAPVQFRLPIIDAPGETRTEYFAPNARRLTAEVPRMEAMEAPRFFRLQVK